VGFWIPGIARVGVGRGTWVFPTERVLPRALS
jgi:hypothetical protein